MSTICDNKLKLEFEEYQFEVISTVPDSLKCSLCIKIVCDPYQCPCGCRFCKPCIIQYLESEDKCCPGKSEDCSDNKLNFCNDIRYDLLANRELNKLIVSCPFVKCSLETDLKQMMVHVTNCTCGFINCELCQESVSLIQYDDHKNNICDNRLIKCQFCDKSYDKTVLENIHQNFEHENLCELYQKLCPKNCGETEEVIWKDHRRVCLETLVPCPYKTMGCDSQEITRKYVMRHCEENGWIHTEMLMKHVDNLNNEMMNLRNQLSLTNETMEKMKEQQTETEKRLISNEGILHRSCGVLFWEISNYDNIRERYIKSPLFYTHHQGYLLALYLYPDGNRMPNFISIVIEIQEGDFDNKLSWPCSKMVTIRIVDQHRLSNDYSFTTFINMNRSLFDHHDRICIRTFISKNNFRLRTQLLKNYDLWIQCFAEDF